MPALVASWSINGVTWTPLVERLAAFPEVVLGQRLGVLGRVAQVQSGVGVLVDAYGDDVQLGLRQRSFVAEHDFRRFGFPGAVAVGGSDLDPVFTFDERDAESAAEELAVAPRFSRASNRAPLL